MKENKNEKLNIISENFSFDLDAILEEYRSFGSSVPAPQSAFSDADYTYRTESGDSFFASYTSGNEFVPEEFVPESSGDYSFSPAAAQE
ncbi:MAG: hypothetical protein MJ135_03355, partial [Oscillospiraceae bacterium]|nr:hypothetical protein [Oscillospiraceae bacterium]